MWPLLAKVIAHAETRPAAIAKMRVALREMVLDGLPSNLDLHRQILADPDFVAGHGDDSGRRVEIIGTASDLQELPDDLHLSVDVRGNHAGILREQRARPTGHHFAGEHRT